MNNQQKIQMRVPQQGLIDPAQMRAEQIAEEEVKRFMEIADKLTEILIENSVLVSEIPLVVGIMTKKINEKIDKSEVDKILKL